MKKEKFLVIREKNHWESETWSFLFKDTDTNREFFNKAKDHYSEDDSYIFYDVELTPNEIEDKKKSSRTSYMNEFNFMDGDYNWDHGIKKIKDTDKERELDPLYKGQYKEFRL